MPRETRLNFVNGNYVRDVRTPSLSPAPTPGPGPGIPLIHYKMNDNASDSIVLDVISAINGTLSNGLSNFTSENSVAGKISTALSFDQSNDTVTSDILDGDFATDYSIALWIFQPTTFVGNVGTAIHFGNAGNGLIFYINLDPGTAGACINPTVGGDSCFYHNGTGTLIGCPALTMEAWTHLVGVWSPSTLTMSIYKDSVLVFSTPITASVDEPTCRVWLGIQNGDANLFLGNLDDVRIYHNTLSQAQIDALYNGGNGTEAELT